MKPEEFLIQLKKRPLFEAIHLIEQALLRSQAQLGSDELPKKEKLELKVNASLGYENAQLVNATLSEHKVFLETNLLGLTGEQGVLPSYYSELAIGREKAGDGAMVDFYNIFNHRLLSLYYRSWQLSQFAVQAREHNKGNRAPLLSSLEAVTGHEKRLNNYYAGLFAQKGRGKGALKDLIEHLTGCDAKLHELQGQWMSVSQDEQTKLAGGSSPEGQFAQLGRGASIGAKAWNINAEITIELFPTNTLQVEQLLPNKSSLATIKSVVQDFVGKHKRINWKLTTRHKHLPQVRLVKGSGQLGIGTVLAKHKRTKDRKITITI